MNPEDRLLPTSPRYRRQAQGEMAHPTSPSNRPPLRPNFTPPQYFPSSQPIPSSSDLQSYVFAHSNQQQPPPGGVLYPPGSPYLAQYTSPLRVSPHLSPSHPYQYPQPYSPRAPPSPENHMFQPIINLPYTSSSPVQAGYPYHQHPSPEHFESAQHAFGSQINSGNPSMPYLNPLDSAMRTHGSASISSQDVSTDLQYSPGPYATPGGTHNPYTYSSPPSFQTGGPSVYSPTYIGPYTQPYYGSVSAEDAKGTWWYLPPPAASAPQVSFDSSLSPSSNVFPSTMRSMSSPTGRSDSMTSSLLRQSQSTSFQLKSPPQGHSVLTNAGDTSVLQMRDLSLSSPPATSNRDRIQQQQHRKAYHPNPTINRSSWVMWVGNVPADATNDELWQFFNQAAEDEADVPDENKDWGGVSSVFLISRSNCAFVNFETQSQLQNAVVRFNGQALRPSDSRCMKLVCRIRKPDDDLKAGVGGQRGMGMHIRWVKEEKQKLKGIESSVPQKHGDSTIDENPAASQATQSTVSDRSLSSSNAELPDNGLKHSSSSGSYASTSSSFLSRHFPKRYFILKSHNESDLHLSVQQSLWATQRHNEPVLDQAFHTSNEVFLVFSANKSGEFFGYARMTGAIRPGGEKQISWSTRSDTDASLHKQHASATPSKGGSAADDSTDGPQTEAAIPFLLSPSEHRVASSPGLLTSKEEAILDAMIVPPDTNSERQEVRRQLPEEQPPGPSRTAPSEMISPHGKLSYEVQNKRHDTLNSSQYPPAMSLDSDHAFRTILDPDKASAVVLEQEKLGSSSREQVRDTDGIMRKDTLVSEEEKVERASKSADDASGPHQAALGSTEGQKRLREPSRDSWGNPFPIEWIRSVRLPFYRTRHLRNPWNHGREVKISRDGTELEPSLGAALLAEWEKLAVSAATVRQQ